MATSVVAIVNNALIKVGANSITSLTENSEAARAANLVYAQLRDTVLRDHPWNFAVTRAACALDSNTPAFDWSYQYFLPDGCLRVLRLQYVDQEYEVEGRLILTNASPCNIKYIAQVTDPNLFDAMFIEALSARIAAELAVTLAESSTLAKMMSEVYREKIMDARSIDGMESGNRQLEGSTWLDSRLNYGDNVLGSM
jgi:hypothetical protein